MKTAEEVFHALEEESGITITATKEADTVVLNAMIIYADQFKPKWISVEPAHDIETCRLFILFESGYIRTDRIIGTMSSDSLHHLGLKATHYCKIHLPEPPNTEEL